MKNEVITTGHTVEEAIEAACEKLQKTRDEVEFEIIDLPSKRILGILGGSDAKVRVYVEETPVDRGKAYLRSILDKMGLSEVELEESKTESGTVLDLQGENLGAVIGRRGETLDAMQYLVSLVANRGEAEYHRIMLDTGNYREKREKTLNALARRMAINAVRTRRNQTLEPMNPYERRIIHSAVQSVAGATSWSVGEDPNRRVVIGIGDGAPKKEPFRK